MALLKTPQGDFGQQAPDFKLPGVDGREYTLKDCAKKNGLVVMFICNHCPYVKAILPRLIDDVKALAALDIGVVAICSNDSNDYPEDNFEHMQKSAKEKHFNFPYLQDITQKVAKAYGAVCTPDFFGYDNQLKLQYRGRLDEGGAQTAPVGAKRELLEAMKMMVKTGKGPNNQIPSMGCSIKWSD
jgi:peroxiredoxin